MYKSSIENDIEIYLKLYLGVHFIFIVCLIEFKFLNIFRKF